MTQAQNILRAIKHDGCGGLYQQWATSGGEGIWYWRCRRCNDEIRINAPKSFRDSMEAERKERAASAPWNQPDYVRTHHHGCRRCSTITDCQVQDCQEPQPEYVDYEYCGALCTDCQPIVAAALAAMEGAR